MIRLALVLAAGLLAAPAAADPIFFTSRTAFQAAAGPLTTESLDTLPAAPPAAPVASFTGPTGVTITGTGLENGLRRETFFALISEGTSSLQTGTFAAGDTLTVTLPAPVTAFGIDFLDTNPLPFALTLTVNGVAGPFASAVSQTTDTNGPLFLGVTDTTPFTTVTIGTLTSPGVVNFDFIQFAQAPPPAAIPEPATAGVFAAVAGACGLIARRRKAARG